MALIALACAACGGGEEVPLPPVDSGGDVATDSAPADAGDAGPVKTGKPAHGTVTGGVTMSSPGYRLVMTMGDSPGGAITMSSPSHKLRTGVVGATQP